MKAVLACPVELHLVVEVALCGFIADRAAVGAPFVALRVVEAVVWFVGLLVGHGTCLWVYPLELWVVIKVVDTATVLTEHVVPCHHATKGKTLGDEVELLFQNEVGIDAGRSDGLRTSESHTLSRVAHIGRTREEAP